MRLSFTIAASVLAFGCSKKSSDGLPPAQDWQAGGSNLPPAGSMQPRPTSPANPHGSVSPANPHGGVAPADPHAGVDMGGAGADPHAGVPMPNTPHGNAPGSGPDVTQMGLSSPDPGRKIDPTRSIQGVLKVHMKAKERVKAGGAVFLIVKKAAPDGTPSGPPLAVDKVLYKDNLAFTLTEANAMVAGTELTGDVIVTARYDQDSDALSKQPGDVTGQTRVKIPAKGIELSLDTVLP
ncbi:MAG: hypothetical protein H0X17_11390 [Deltaproteobacteria bacterium]|nr:hypothetical protein [Deltaproteobacteria bacterium]